MNRDNLLSPLSDAEAQNALLQGMLERGEAWKCVQCGEVNGLHNLRCWNCRHWLEDDK
jgi:hypothetical protein